MIREWLLSLITEAIMKAVYGLVGKRISPLEEAHFILGDYEVNITRRKVVPA